MGKHYVICENKSLEDGYSKSEFDLMYNDIVEALENSNIFIYNPVEFTLNDDNFNVHAVEISVGINNIKIKIHTTTTDQVIYSSSLNRFITIGTFSTIGTKAESIIIDPNTDTTMICTPSGYFNNAMIDINYSREGRGTITLHPIKTIPKGTELNIVVEVPK